MKTLSLGGVIRRLREGKGWSQRELARHAGLSQQAVNFLEADKYDPKLSTVAALAAALEVGPETFFKKSDKRA